VCQGFADTVIRHSCEVVPIPGDRVQLSGAHDGSFQPLGRFGGLPILYGNQRRLQKSSGMHAVVTATWPGRVASALASSAT
jgi:hypothetical protein